ncbi:MAG: threonine/serine exporter family protein [Eubacteriales bacterium]|nr:threonine/serine exporter family protein [Eubacteriales bacterium]
MMKEWLLPIVSAALGSLSFAMFFGVRSRKLWFSLLGGALNWGLYLLAMKKIGLPATMAYALGAAAGTLYAEILARIVKTPVTVFVITSVIPMVPGGSLYYTMLGLLQGDKATFVDRGLYTLSAAGAMALGIFAATMLFRLLFTVGRAVCSAVRRAH